MSKIIANTGRRGKGKSSLAYWEACSLNRGVVVFDTTHGFNIGQIVHNRAELETAIDADLTPIVYQPENTGLESDFIEREFAEFITPLKHIRNISVLVDESSYLQSPNWIAPALDDELRTGRRREHDVIFTQHRIQDCNGLLLTLVSDFRFFQTKHPRDLERIEELAGARTAQTVAQLQGHQWLGWDVERETAFVHTDPTVWRVAIDGASPTAAHNLAAAAKHAPETFPEGESSPEVVH